jgi:cytochrome c
MSKNGGFIMLKIVRRARALVSPLFALPLFVPAAVADGDIVKGEKIFKKCVACHAIGEPTSKTGPHLVGIIGRSVASIEGYSFSESMKEFSKTNPTWDETSLSAYLENPRKMVPKTKMAFPRNQKERKKNLRTSFPS